MKKTNFDQICVKNVKVCGYCMCGTHQLTRVPLSKAVDNAAGGEGGEELSLLALRLYVEAVYR